MEENVFIVNKKVNEESDFKITVNNEIIICDKCEGRGCNECKNTGRKIKKEFVYTTTNLNSGIPRSFIYEKFTINTVICDKCKGNGYIYYSTFAGQNTKERKDECDKCKGLGRYMVFKRFIFEDFYSF